MEKRDPKKIKKKYASARKLRWLIIPASFFAANSWFKVFSTKEIYKGPLRKTCLPFLNCHACPTCVSSCPIGILQAHASNHTFPTFLIGFLGAIGIIFGRAACGWLCPFGYMQDWMYKIKTKKIVLPKFLIYGKYVSLVVLAILLPYFLDGHWFSRFCPWGTILAGIPWGIWNPVNPVFNTLTIPLESFGFMYWLKIGMLILFLAAFVLIKRPFCRVFCPLGAIYAFFNRISFMKMHVNHNGCVNCGLCKKVCPVDIRIGDDPGSPECIRCIECTVCKNIRVKWSMDNGREKQPAVKTAPQN